MVNIAKCTYSLMEKANYIDYWPYGRLGFA